MCYFYTYISIITVLELETENFKTCMKSFKIAKQTHYILSQYILCVQIVYIIYTVYICLYIVHIVYIYTLKSGKSSIVLHFCKSYFFVSKEDSLDAHISFCIQPVEISQYHVASGKFHCMLISKKIRVQKENARHSRRREGRRNVAA